MFEKAFAHTEKTVQHFYCVGCKGYLGKNSDLEDNAVCDDCETNFNKSESVKNGVFFLEIAFENQIKFLLEENNLVGPSETDDAYRDIVDGDLYRASMQEPGISLLWNTE